MDEIQKAKRALKNEVRSFIDFSMRNGQVYATCKRCSGSYVMSGSNGMQHRNACKKRGGIEKNPRNPAFPPTSPAPALPPVPAAPAVPGTPTDRVETRQSKKKRMMANPPAPAVPPVRATPRVETRQSKKKRMMANPPAPAVPPVRATPLVRRVIGG